MNLSTVHATRNGASRRDMRRRAHSPLDELWLTKYGLERDLSLTQPENSKRISCRFHRSTRVLHLRPKGHTGGAVAPGYRCQLKGSAAFAITSES